MNKANLRHLVRREEPYEDASNRSAHSNQIAEGG